MKKRTLNQTWTLCLRMWRWIVKMKAKNNRRWISTLKSQWLHLNNVKIEGSHNCFFCELSNRHSSCVRCPGKLVTRSFNCTNIMYHYKNQPAAFYKELLRLNRIRKTKK